MANDQPEQGKASAFVGLGNLQLDAYPEFRRLLGQPEKQEPRFDQNVKRGQLLNISLTVEGQAREYEMYVPASYKPEVPTKVVMAFHGATIGQNAARGLMAKETAFNQKAEQENFVVLYPMAKNRPGSYGSTIQAWNVPNAGNLMETDRSYDDMKYIDSVISDVKQKLNVDAGAISAAGFSDGGRIIGDYATRRPGALSAIASVHGTAFDIGPSLNGGTPAFVIHSVHGGLNPLSRDLMLPYKGGWGIATRVTGAFPGGARQNPSLQFDKFSLSNNCSGTPDLVSTNEYVMRHFTPTQCRDGEVKELLIRGGQHAWDGKDGSGGFPLIGSRGDTPVSVEVLKFLLPHRAKEKSLPLYRQLGLPDIHRTWPDGMRADATIKRIPAAP